MASGVPVVAVRAGGIPDIITKQGQTGYLYAPGGCWAASNGGPFDRRWVLPFGRVVGAGVLG